MPSLVAPAPPASTWAGTDAHDWACLAIVPHPDDMEYGASAAVAAWTGRRQAVAYVLVTRGEAGHRRHRPAEAGRSGSAEQRAACDAVGVESLEFLDHPDGTIEYGIPLRRDLAAAIRRHRPELVVTLNHRETSRAADGTWPTTGWPAPR